MIADARALLYACWGKAATDVDGGHHPAVLHMLDVAAVGLELLDLPTSTRQRAVLCECLSAEQIALLVACHDLGKVSPGFQAKVPELARPLAAKGLDFPLQARTDHGLVGAVTLPPLLTALGADHDAAFTAAAAVCAHHGSRPVPERQSRRRHGGPAWQDLRELCVEALANALGVDDLAPLITGPDGWTARLAGLTSVADWLGSSVEFFPYAPDATPTPAYLEQARARARRALDATGWSRWQGPAGPHDFGTLFPGYTPNAVQCRVSERMSDPELPELLIIEAPTGTGKTEAALVALERWLARDGLAGAYVALPTQATSNQMFGRVQDFLGRLDSGGAANLHLVHGAASLQQDYRELRIRSVDDPGNASPAVVADRWFQSSRRALLSPFAVGTVDQAMLAALQARHFFVRLFALADKVVVIDEVHAYDAFMSRIIDRLVSWLRSLGARVVLLSATLPSARRTELVKAWGGEPPTDNSGGGYPRITAVRAGEPSEVISVEPPMPRTVSLRWTDGQAAVEKVVRLVGDGAQVAYVCNTVAEAQATFRALAAAGLAQDTRSLFHARFPLEDRQRTEAEVLSRFDKAGARETGHVVVATQVIEQSLDLDFDVMFTELAPIDLLIQRAGRLHRHERKRRPPGTEAPTLHIIRPSVDGAEPGFGASGFVYHRHVLLRTWAALRERDHWVVPADVPALVASVYDEADSVPADLAEDWERSRIDLERVLSRAWHKTTDTLVPPPGKADSFFEGVNRALSDELDGDLPPGLRVRTRDIGASVRLLCVGPGSSDDTVRLRPDGGAEIPLHAPPSPGQIRALSLRTVSITHRRWLPLLRQHALRPDAWQRVPRLRGSLVLPFLPDGRCAIDALDLQLDPTLGLVFPALTRDSR